MSAREPGTGARLLIDLGPLLVFFAVNFARSDVIEATLAFMVAISTAETPIAAAVASPASAGSSQPSVCATAQMLGALRESSTKCSVCRT